MIIETCYKEALCNAGIREVLPKGVSLSKIDDNRDYIYYLQEGLCALVRKTKADEEVIYNYLQDDSLLGVICYGLGEDRYSKNQETYFVTKTKCVVYKIPHKAINQLVDQDPQMGFMIAIAMSQHFSDVLNHFQSANHDLTNIRLCKMFLQLAKPEQDEYVLDKYFRYNEIAKYLGVHVVTIARIMQELKSQNIIQKKGQQIVYKDKNKLKEMIDHYSEYGHQVYA